MIKEAVLIETAGSGDKVSPVPESVCRLVERCISVLIQDGSAG